jgi:hypothetical protein
VDCPTAGRARSDRGGPATAVLLRRGCPWPEVEWSLACRVADKRTSRCRRRYAVACTSCDVLSEAGPSGPRSLTMILARSSPARGRAAGRTDGSFCSMRITGTAGTGVSARMPLVNMSPTPSRAGATRASSATPRCYSPCEASARFRGSSTKRPVKGGIPEAGATGLEPATSGVTGRRSNQLSYAPGGGFTVSQALPDRVGAAMGRRAQLSGRRSV